MIKREKVKNLLTNCLKILKDILISESYMPAWSYSFAMKTHKKGIYA